MSTIRTSTFAGRRAFLQQGALVLTAASLGSSRAVAADPDRKLSIGLITDLHYADKPTAGSRFYRDTPQKLEMAAQQFAKSKVDLLIELGDLIDAANSVALEQSYLKRINKQFSAICADRHYVLGNHCVDTLTKAEFLGSVEQEKSYYSFDRQGIHFVVLDACFREDGVPYQRKNFDWTDPNIPPEELEWLQADLAATSHPVIVLAHQRLDVSNNHGVKNGPAVRKILEEAGDVLAVFQGHSHVNHLSEIGGIPYCTMAAMIEGSGEKHNAYSLIEIDSQATITIKGFGQQKNYLWS